MTRNETARWLIDGGRSVAEVARELNLHENLFRTWVAAERVRDGAVADARGIPPDGDLSAVERAELVRLRAEVAGKEHDITFLKKEFSIATPPYRRPFIARGKTRSGP
jgi:transposase-like protein